MIRIFTGLLLLPLLLFSSACPSSPSSPPSKRIVKIITIPNGAGLSQIVKILEKKGILRYSRLFWLRVKILGKDNQLKAGQYEFSSDMKHGQILDFLVKGKVLRHRVTIPEGLTIKEIAMLLSQTGLVNGAEFLQKAKEVNFVKTLGIPASHLEGFLFPSTYFLVQNQFAKELIREMVKNYHAVFNRTYRKRARELGFSELEIVTLASIIEKETGSAKERPTISSVFHNRLKRKMKLQSDPTTIYGIPNFDGNLTKKHLQRYTPYNTYIIKGLPPGPIANPGKESIHAALNPETTDYLYFVSKNDGTHVFSTNVRDHNRAVDYYQRKRRNRNRSR